MVSPLYVLFLVTQILFHYKKNPKLLYVLFQILHRNKTEYKDNASLELEPGGRNAIDPTLQMLCFICTSNNLTPNSPLIQLKYH